jgi:hypothetical protein
MLLFSRIHPVIWSVRGFAHTIALPLVAVSASRNPEWTIRVSVSRNVVFHSTALAVSGLFLLLDRRRRLLHALLRWRVGEALQLALLFGGALFFGDVLLRGVPGAPQGVPGQELLRLPLRLPDRMAGCDPVALGGG